MYSDLLAEIRKSLLNHQAVNLPMSSLKNISGGNINDCFEFSFGDIKYFLKINSGKKFPGMLEAEARGLNELSGKSFFNVPLPRVTGNKNNFQFLVLSHLDKTLADEAYWSQLGQGIATLHKNTGTEFGLDYDNYIGSLTQKNSFKSNFADFFIVNRLEPQLKDAIDNGALEISSVRYFENLFAKLEKIIPPESPSLLHGDLWSGNVMPTSNGPAIFDPAVYYGHREADIAMTILFGGFSQVFYESYQDEFPLEKGWQKRTQIFNLYPLLVHVNLFGGSYMEQVSRIIKQF